MSSGIIYTSSINQVAFSTQDQKSIRLDSAVPVTTYDLFKGSIPYPQGPYDPHMGPSDNGYPCATCQNTKKLCLGHEGHTVLRYPVQAPLFMSDIKKWLRLICFKCGTSVVEPHEYARIPKNKKLDEASKIARSGAKICPKCRTPHPTITKDKERALMIIAEDRDEKRKVKETHKLYPARILDIFNRISNDTVEVLGKSIKSHPRNLILNIIKIPPVTIRPDVRKIGSARTMNNDLTTLIQNIVKENEKIPPVIPEEIDQKLESNIYALGDLYYAFIKGTTNKKPIGSTTTFSLAKMLRGKSGFFRKNLQGKRVRIVARTTIAGDPNLKINQVGIPLRFAKILQVEEIVQEYNKKKLMINYLNAESKYPGCTKIIKRNTGTEYSVSNINNNIELEIGDKLYRDLEDGDYILYCRQPSLLPSNISAMEVVVTMDPEILTFRMNVLVCPLNHWLQVSN